MAYLGHGLTPRLSEGVSVARDVTECVGGVSEWLGDLLGDSTSNGSEATESCVGSPGPSGSKELPFTNSQDDQRKSVQECTQKFRNFT